MEVKVKLSNFRAAPRKARHVVDLVRGKDVQEAVSILSFTINKSALPVLKLLNSAITAAKNDFKLEENNLFISKITVDEGPKLKRWHPMSRGRAYPIIKRTSHIALVLSEKNPTDRKEKTESVAVKPQKADVKASKTIRKAPAKAKKSAAKRKATKK
jgi:large subunit ribosomal protein L22